MLNRFLLAIMMLLISTELSAQQKVLHEALEKIATETSTEEWINVRKEVVVPVRSFFSAYKSAMKLTDHDDMRLRKTELDDIGMKHDLFDQYYKGIRVFAAEYWLHSKNNALISGNGKLVTGLDLSPIPRIKASDAFSKAIQYFPSKKYAWEVPSLENSHKLAMHDSNASYRPIPVLVWASSKNSKYFDDPSFYKLCYMIDITNDHLVGFRLFISAYNGKLEKKYPLNYTCSSTSANTNFYGVKPFSVNQVPASNPAQYYLWNNCSGAFVHTRQWRADGNHAEYITDLGGWGVVPSAVTSHWGVSNSITYFSAIHGRNSWNNAGGGINVYHDAQFCSTGNCGGNAGFLNGNIWIGNNDTQGTIDDWNSFDITAHEIAHGVTTTSANLIYEKEPGALNESFSDIFGVCAYAWLLGMNPDIWKVGFDRKFVGSPTVSQYIRNMANPNDRGDPDTYLGTNWRNTTSPTDPGDNWGVHTNSGVQNFMFYLMVNGGSGVNDFGTPYSVAVIGILTSRIIAYRALTLYLTTNSQYADARNAWVHAAVDLYGECSYQAIETGKAWAAVGIPPPYFTTIQICGQYGLSSYSTQTAYDYLLGTNCLVNIVPFSNVEFGANKVTMGPGFTAGNSSRFRAYVSDCRYAAY